MPKDPESSSPFIRELDIAREYQAEAELMRVDARRRFRLAVLDAHQRGGMGATLIARHLEVTRQSVYEVLGAARKDFPDRS